MINTENIFIKILSAYVNNDDFEIYDFDCDELMHLADIHSVSGIVAAVLLKKEDKLSKEFATRLKNILVATTVRGVKQEIETNKIIKIDIDYVLALDENKKIDRRKLQDSISKIDILFRPVFKVKDRAFTILETSTTIVDDILHFSFELNFVDCLSDEEFGGIKYELMKHLEMTWR